MNDYLTWGSLATFAGAAAATGLLTQFLKKAGPLAKLPTQWLSFFIALVIMVAATAASGGWAQTWEVWALVPLNAVMVSLTANGAYAVAARTTTRTEQQQAAGKAPATKAEDVEGAEDSDGTNKKQD